jgi:hypothetical protein
MPTRFDHAVIVVRDLDAALTQFRSLGFDAQPGGKHTGRGTYNGLIRFGLDYFELLAVYDEAEARAFRRNGRIPTDVLAGREATLAGYALATVDIEQDATRFTGMGDVFPIPQPMQRARPDGQLLTWRVLAAGGGTWDSWGKPWPFLIQWDASDEQRLQIDKPGLHANGVTSWASISLVTRDLASAATVYQEQLRLATSPRSFLAAQVADSQTFSLGQSTIQLLAPRGDGPAQQLLAGQGEGTYALECVVKDLAQTQAFLDERSIQYTREGNGYLLDPGGTLGVQLRLRG